MVTYKNDCGYYKRTKTIFKWRRIFEQYWTEMWDFNEEAIKARPRKQKKALKQVQELMYEDFNHMLEAWEEFSEEEKRTARSYGDI